MGTRGKLRGFTLIELLISITILGLVIGLATYGFSLFSRHWEGPRDDFERSAGQMQRLDLVSRAVNDALPWIVKDENGKLGFYFLGRDEGLTLVTSSPIYSVGAPAVIRLFREPEGSGRWRLVYEEAPLGGTLLRNGSQTLPFQYRLVVLAGLTKLEFRYFGWSSLSEKLQGDEPGSGLKPQWWPEYDGLVRIQQPQKIAFKIDEFEAVFPMPDRSRALIDRASPAS
jgi:prepilin-type N-terminal cleavage/methylation domain-containing protein